MEVGRALVAEHKANVRGQIRDTNTVTGFDIGCQPLHACVALAEAEHEKILSLLLDSGADVNAQSKAGM